MEVVPEVVAPLLQLEGVVGPAVRASSIQVAIPEDTDAYSTTLHMAYHRSTDTMAQDPLPVSSQNLTPTDPPAMPGPQRPLQQQPQGPQCGILGRRDWRMHHSGSA